jgi:carbon monoxide dehydrogenase subunit G
MHLEGTVSIQAARDRVWAFLTDPHQVSQCAPGVESVEVVEPGKTFRATASVGFGNIKARFSGDVEWLELEAPNRARMKAHGTAPGSAADVVSEMRLSEEAAGATTLHWSADVTVVGQLASLAARLMTSVSQKLVGLFFDCVRQKIETAAAAAGAAAAAAAVPPPPEAAASPLAGTTAVPVTQVPLADGAHAPAPAASQAPESETPQTGPADHQA